METVDGVAIVLISIGVALEIRTGLGYRIRRQMLMGPLDGGGRRDGLVVGLRPVSK